ncbi:MAG: OmpA family protein [Porphyromonas sp.]|nr:OmpA family protein [Porphyromonas sp.]
MKRIRVYLLSLGLIAVSGFLSWAKAQDKVAEDGSKLIRVRTADLVAVLDSLANSSTEGQSIENLRKQWLLSLLLGGQQQSQTVIGSTGYNASYDARLRNIEQLLQLRTRTNRQGNSIIVLPRESKHSMVQPQYIQAAPSGPQNTLVQNTKKTIDSVIVTQTLVPAQTLAPAQTQATVQTKNDTIYIKEPTAQPIESVESVSESLSCSVYFPVGSAVLNAASKNLIKEVASTLAANPELKLRLSAYASPEGNKANNERLAKRRYQSVVNEFMHYGIDASRLNTTPNLGIDLGKRIPDLARRVDIIAE